MTRPILAITAALFAAAAYFVPAAQACISCEYVPPVVNTPVYSYGAHHYKKRRVHRSVKRRIRRARRHHIVETEIEPEIEAEAEVKAKKTETAKSVPVDLKSENSTISTASVDKSEADTKKTPSKEPEADKNVSCKKFFPSVGMTLTVPCD